MSQAVLLTSTLSDLPVRRGKVRDMYDLGHELLMVSTDRISAFDYILPTGIPDKGRILTQVSLFWFNQLEQPNHLISADVDAMDLPASADRESLRGRSMLVRKTRVIPIECVVRGYLAGSGWKEYQQSQAVCGVSLPPGLVQADKLPESIFTPATKAESGHDENITFAQMVDLIGRDVAEQLRERSLTIYEHGATLAAERGIIVADTKFEWGWDGEELLLIDEAMTPDSSRFWPADKYRPGGSPPSFDKQFVRDWLESSSWDKNSPPPPLPDEIVARTRDKYIEAYERLTGKTLAC